MSQHVPGVAHALLTLDAKEFLCGLPRVEGYWVYDSISSLLYGKRNPEVSPCPECLKKGKKFLERHVKP